MVYNALSELESGRTEHDVGEIFRLFGQAYERRYPMRSEQRKALRAIAVCRMKYLGGHLEQCDHCDFERPCYNSCRNVHCPKCQGMERQKWVNKRLKELLPVPMLPLRCRHFGRPVSAGASAHVVFTLPSEISDELKGFGEMVYRELFRASSQTLLYFFKSKRGGQPGLIGVLHSWGQTMSRHPHVHFLVTGGCLSFDKKRWVPSGSEYLFEVKELSADFRKRFLKGLKRNEVELSELKAEEKDWVVYCRKPFAGPERMIEYQGRYVNRTAISNRRIQSITEGEVTFDYKDYRDEDEKGVPKHKSMIVDGVTFIRLFLQHVQPSHFRRIRYYGILAGKTRSQKIRCVRKLFNVVDERASTQTEDGGREHWIICPKCRKGELVVVSILFRIRPPPIIFANERVREPAA